jgi:NitT/TauT family transport system permease protein
MFAALVLVSLTGVGIFALFEALARRLLGRWHETGR